MTKIAIPASEAVFELSAGELSLDFANTLAGKRLTAPRERLNSYADLVAWAEQSGILGTADGSRLLEAAAKHPRRSAAVLEAARDLREAIYRLWVASIRKERPSREDLALLNARLSEALSRQRLMRDGDRYALGWPAQDALESILWPVAKSAAELLTSERAERVRRCEEFEATECAWLFLDETRNRSRRWCSMSSCGNRAKARRHYQRTRQAESSEEHEHS